MSSCPTGIGLALLDRATRAFVQFSSRPYLLGRSSPLAPQEQGMSLIV